MSLSNDSQQTVENEVNELLQQECYGVTLREAREKAGLSIDDVSEKILISADILKSIENSQSDALPSVAFAQGYIRSYAKILNLQADSIIEAYLKTVPEQQQLSPRGLVATPQTSNSLLLTGVLFGLLAIIGFTFWLFNSTSITEVVEQSVTDSQVIVPEISSRDQSVDDPLDNHYQLIETNVGSLEELTSSEDSFIKDEQLAMPAEVVSMPAMDVISINAQKDTWCELQDADGNRLVYRIVKKGEQLLIEGKAPFSVFLGVSSAVSIDVNRQLVKYEHLIEDDKKTILLEISSSGEVKRLNRS